MYIIRRKVMDRIDEEKLERRLYQHGCWWRTGGRVGERLEIYRMDLSGLDLSELLLPHSVFIGCDLSGVNFFNSKLTHACFEDSICINTNFSWAKLDVSSFFNTDIAEANFALATLDNADLRPAITKNINLAYLGRASVQIPKGTRKKDPENNGKYVGTIKEMEAKPEEYRNYPHIFDNLDKLIRLR
jgi:hypothetical protein